MTGWHPILSVTAVEWEMVDPQERTAYVVIRRIEFGPKREVWFRVVTGHGRKSERRLVGWCRTIEAAAEAGWDYHLAFSSWRHHLAASRADRPAVEPDPHDLLMAYREAEAAQARSAQDQQPGHPRTETPA